VSLKEVAALSFSAVLHASFNNPVVQMLTESQQGKRRWTLLFIRKHLGLQHERWHGAAATMDLKTATFAT